MRPSFHWATGWPFSAAYSRALTPVLASPARKAWAPDRKASTGVRLRLISGGRTGAATLGMGAGGTGADKPTEPITGTAGRGTASRLMTGAIPSRGPPPSNAKADTKPRPAQNSAAGMRQSDIRIAPDLCCPAGMGHGAATRGAHLLGVFPKITRREIGLFLFPAPAARLELRRAQLDVERAVVGIELDDVAVLDERD